MSSIVNKLLFLIPWLFPSPVPTLLFLECPSFFCQERKCWYNEKQLFVLFHFHILGNAGDSENQVDPCFSLIGQHTLRGTGQKTEECVNTAELITLLLATDEAGVVLSEEPRARWTVAPVS